MFALGTRGPALARFRQRLVVTPNPGGDRLLHPAPIDERRAAQVALTKFR